MCSTALARPAVAAPLALPHMLLHSTSTPLHLLRRRRLHLLLLLLRQLAWPLLNNPLCQQWLMRCLCYCYVC
jgi:hypothetical protein